MSEQRQLLNLAYRLLGSLADAEDVLQETYARWYALSPDQRDTIESPGAWLTRVAGRICLDVLGSARARRERYVGEWIPEPLPDREEWGGGPDPADRVTLDESVTMAFLVVLEQMTPAERVSFVLHDVYRFRSRRSRTSSAGALRRAGNWPRPRDGGFAHRSATRSRPRGRRTWCEISDKPGKRRTSRP
ncbi:sigma factor [Lentzea albidocapillata]|uniref:sigma factor n=1 Tax=Lentzea albidocapillata TaxID=40571 RepID=UPI003B849CFA